MIALEWQADIRASAERVFGLLADLRSYDRWLPRSSAFHGTAEISPGPIGVGTTYVEPGPFGVRHGRVTEFEPPVRLSFEQPMRGKLPMTGTIGIRLTHTLTPETDAVHLVRHLELSPRGPVRLFMPFIVPAFRTENARMIAALKAYAETAGD